jgi:hypothetical protein
MARRKKANSKGQEKQGKTKDPIVVKNKVGGTDLEKRERIASKHPKGAVLVDETDLGLKGNLSVSDKGKGSGNDAMSVGVETVGHEPDKVTEEKSAKSTHSDLKKDVGTSAVEPPEKGESRTKMSESSDDGVTSQQSQLSQSGATGILSTPPLEPEDKQTGTSTYPSDIKGKQSDSASGSSFYSVRDVLPNNYKYQAPTGESKKGEHKSLIKAWSDARDHISKGGKILILTPTGRSLAGDGLSSFGTLHKETEWRPSKGHGQISFGYFSKPEMLNSLPDDTRVLIRSTPPSMARKMSKDEKIGSKFSSTRRGLDKLNAKRSDKVIGRVMIPCPAYQDLLRVSRGEGGKDEGLESMIEDIILDAETNSGNSDMKG